LRNKQRSRSADVTKGVFKNQVSRRKTNLVHSLEDRDNIRERPKRGINFRGERRRKHKSKKVQKKKACNTKPRVLLPSTKRGDQLQQLPEARGESRRKE